MGLDAVELVIRIEETFSIDLPDEELSSIRTVGDLYELVLSKVDTTPACLSSKAFYKTRRALMDSLDLSRRSVRPSTSLESLLPSASRIRQWKEIGGAIGLEFPRLRHSRSRKDLFLNLSFVIATLAILAAWGGIHMRGWMPASGYLFWISAFLAWVAVLGIANGLLISRAQPFATELPVNTVGDLARMVLTLNYTAFAPASNGSDPLSREDLWERIVYIFADQLGLESEDIVPAARISEDLGVD